MSLTPQNQDLFRAAVELVRNGYLGPMPSKAELVENSPVEPSNIVQTHESYAEFAETHGEGTATMFEGRQIHYWRGVQFGKGTPRGTLYLMEFDNGPNASFFL